MIIFICMLLMLRSIARQFIEQLLLIFLCMQRHVIHILLGLFAEQNFFHVRYISLVLLTIQNSALILVMHYVRTREGDMFFPACAVVASETVKLFICLLVILYQVTVPFF